MRDGDDGRTVFVERSPFRAEPSGSAPPSEPDEGLPTFKPVARRPRRAVAKRDGAPPARPRRRFWRVAAFTLVLAWASAATWAAVSGYLAVQKLEDESAESRRVQDEKVRALTRRLVGVASHQFLEQDGLSDRLADIIARQVDLENRQSTLLLLGERMSEARGVAPPTGPLSAPPAIRLGPVADPAARDRRGALEPGGAGRPAARLSAAPDGLSLREQFARLEGAMNRLASGQMRVVDGFARGATREIASVQGAVSEVGLKLDGAESAAFARIRPGTGPGTGRRRDADPFEAGIDALQLLMAERDRWLALADSVPFRAPLPGGGLTSNFGTRKDPFTGAATLHAGMDFRSPVGTPIQTGARGRVITAGQSGGYGNLVEIEHGHDLVTRYGHLSAIAVAVGQTVAPGTVVGLVGSTGRSTGPHLHYETRIAGSAVDPVRFLKAGASLSGQPLDFSSEPAPGEAAAEEASFD